MNSSPSPDRSRLARELHDGLAQELAAFGYQLDSIIGNEKVDQIPRNELRRLRSVLTGMIEQVRYEIFELRSDQSRSLIEAIAAQQLELLKDSNIEFELIGSCEVSKEIQYELIRCIRELILNSKHHSNCSQIQITLSPESIEYQDNGKFEAAKGNNRFGILGIKERLQKIGFSYQQNGSLFRIQMK